MPQTCGSTAAKNGFFKLAEALLSNVSLSRCITCQGVCVQQSHVRLPSSDFK